MTLRDEARNLIGQSLDRFGHVDILINNPGASSAGPLEAHGQAPTDKQAALWI